MTLDPWAVEHGGAGEVLSQNSWTQGLAQVTVHPGRATTIQSR